MAKDLRAMTNVALRLRPRPTTTVPLRGAARDPLCRELRQFLTDVLQDELPGKSPEAVNDLLEMWLNVARSAEAELTRSKDRAKKLRLLEQAHAAFASCDRPLLEGAALSYEPAVESAHLALQAERERQSTVPLPLLLMESQASVGPSPCKMYVMSWTGVLHHRPLPVDFFVALEALAFPGRAGLSGGTSWWTACPRSKAAQQSWSHVRRRYIQAAYLS
jgi:hypothetical protein